MDCLLSDDISLKYPLFFRPMFEVLENGWDAFQPEREFGRFKEISEDWRLSYVNKDYTVSFLGKEILFVTGVSIIVTSYTMCL